MTLVTSGYHPDRLERALVRAMDADGDFFLRVGVSLDGVGELHDSIRGVREAFLRGMREPSGPYVITQALSPPSGTRVHVFPSLQPGLHRGNPAISCHSYPMFLGFSLLRCEPRDPKSSAGLDRDRYFQLKRKYASRALTDAPHFLERTIAAKNRALIAAQEDALAQRSCFPCRAGSLSIVICEDGEVVACESKDILPGPPPESRYDLRSILASSKAQEVRAGIVSGACSCGHECNLTTNMFFSSRGLLKWSKYML